MGEQKALYMFQFYIVQLICYYRVGRGGIRLVSILHSTINII